MSLREGQQVASYRLLEKVGQGGMGVVWKALDTRLDRQVALKFLPETFETDPERFARFVREAKALAALNLPTVVTVHAVEEIDGRPFIVMEYVRGRTLDDITPETGLPLDRFLSLAIALADAVGAAHECGINHGDLKPANIMVDERGQPKILDFGLASWLQPPVDTDTSEVLTRTLPTSGQIVGSVCYMSPEQASGKPTDHRSDLFSLGVILYKLATGCAPFTGDSTAEVIASVLRDQPRPVTEVRRGLPRQLARILQHALEKSATRRFQTAADLRNELEQLQLELERGEIGVDGTSLARDVRSVAVLPLVDLSDDPDQAFFADSMTDALINTLARISALKVISRTSVMRYKGASQPVQDTARELGVDAVVEASVLRAGSRLRITAQLIDASRDRLLWAESYEERFDDVLELQGRVARAIAERIEVELTPQEHAQLTHKQTVVPAAHEAYLRGRHLWYKRTTESVRRGLAYFERATTLDPSYAPAHAGIADSYIVDGGRYLGVTPKVAYDCARAAALKALELDDQLAEAHTSLAAVMTDYDWDWEGADREYRRAIELNPNYVTAHSWYAEQLSRMGRHDEAVDQARQARELDPLSLASHMILSWILFFARRYDEAIEQGLRTLELDADYATAHRILGWAYEETGRYDEAITAHQKAAALTDQQPNFRGQLGRAFALAGRTDEARRVLDELLEISQQSYVSSFDIAIICTALGEVSRALDWLDRAYQEHADHLPYLKVNPRLDPLRAEPRFQRLLERIGLASASNDADSSAPRPSSSDRSS